MPFWLRDLFSLSWRPATPADILEACELLKGKGGLSVDLDVNCAASVIIRSDGRMLTSNQLRCSGMHCQLQEHRLHKSTST